MHVMKNTFECTIEDMTCGGCVKRITKAVQNLDSSAEINADVETRKVRIETVISAKESITTALAAIGYAPTFTN